MVFVQQKARFTRASCDEKPVEALASGVSHNARLSVSRVLF